MSKPYGTVVLIGRFQPLHNAHLEIIKRCTALTDQLVVVIGSANQPRTYKNPFTYDERARMIKAATAGLSLRVYTEPNIDTIYNDQAWAVRIQGIHSKYQCLGTKTAIIGHKKDQSSEYLDFFPQWDFVNVEEIEPLSAVNIRDLYFTRTYNSNFIKNVVPETTYDFLQEFRRTMEFEQIVREREFVETYKKQFAGLVYPPVFVTTDAVVIQSGHVLLVERKSEPGKGLLALPGGFLNQNERIIDGVIRELREETKIKVPGPVLRGSIKRTEVFDHPDRSARGRTITHACLIELPDGELPKVKGADDAKTAKWYPIGNIDSATMFEDHYQIIKEMTGV